MANINTRRGSPAQSSTYVYCPAPAGEEPDSTKHGLFDGHVDPRGQHGLSRHLKQLSMDSARSQQNLQSPFRHADDFRNFTGIPTGEQLFGHDEGFLGGPVDTPTRRRDGHSRHPSHMSVESAHFQRSAFEFGEELHDIPTLPKMEHHDGQSLRSGRKYMHGQDGGHSRHPSQMSHHSGKSFVSALRGDMPTAPAGEHDQILPHGPEVKDGQHGGHTCQLSQFSMKSTRTHQSAQGSLADYKYSQIPDMPVPAYDQEAAQGFPIVDRPSDEMIAIGAFPNDLDPLEHTVCFGLIQESQVALEFLKHQVEIGKNDAEISKDRIETLEAEISHLRTKAVQSASDKQDFRDRIDALMGEVRYLSTLPHNEKYLDKFMLFEAEARVYRETKFRSEQAHAKEIDALKEDMSTLENKLRVTEEVYGAELKRAGTLKDSAVRSLRLTENRVENLTKSLHHELKIVSQLRNELEEFREWKKEAERKDEERIFSITALFESVATAVRHSNDQIEMAAHGLAGLL